MRWTFVVAVSIVGILLVAGPALAGKDEGTEKIGWGDSISIKIATEGKTLDVEYDVTVVDGARVSVYYTNQKGRDDYYDPSKDTFSYAVDYSVKNTLSASKSFRETEGGTWYVIIENADTNAVGDNSTVLYKVTWEELSAGDWLVNIGICIGIVVVLLIVGFFIRKIRRKVSSQPTPSPMQPYDQQYQPPQYGEGSPPRPMTPPGAGPGQAPPGPDQGYDPNRPPY